MGVVLICEGSLKPEDAWIAVKTQFAGPEIHPWIVGLLKYLIMVRIPPEVYRKRAILAAVSGASLNRLA